MERKRNVYQYIKTSDIRRYKRNRKRFEFSDAQTIGKTLYEV